MNHFLLYKEDILPVCLILAVIWIAEWAVTQKRGYRSTLSHQMLKLVFAVYLLFLFQMTVSLSSLWQNLQSGQLTLQGGQMWEPFQEIRDYWNYGSEKEILTNLLGNVAIFVPMGVLPPLLWKWCRRPWGILPWLIVPTVVIEGCQLLTPRATSVDDLILNACGGMLGYLLFWVLRLCGLGKHTTLKREKS